MLSERRAGAKVGTLNGQARPRCVRQPAKPPEPPAEDNPRSLLSSLNQRKFEVWMRFEQSQPPCWRLPQGLWHWLFKPPPARPSAAKRLAPAAGPRGGATDASGKVVDLAVRRRSGRHLYNTLLEQHLMNVARLRFGLTPRWSKFPEQRTT